MASLEVFSCLILSLIACAYCNVPVLIWESSKSEKISSFPALYRISSEDFQQYLTKKVRGEQLLPLIVLFSEESLSMEDFSWQDTQGHGYFPELKYIANNAANVEFMPSVQDPIEATKHLKSKLSKDGYSMQLIDSENIGDLPDGCSKILITKLQEAKPEEDRPDLLRRHDIKIAEVYSLLLSKCSHVIGILSGEQSSWIEQEEVTRMRRSADDNKDGDNNSTAVNGPYTLYQDSRGVSMLYSKTDPKLIIDGKEIQLGNYSSATISGDNSKPNYIKLFAKYGADYRLIFNFDNMTNGYWYLRTVDLEILKPNKEEYVLKSMLDINAPLGMSYHCGTPVIFRNGTKELVFSDIQVEPFFFKPGSKSFSDAIDAVPFFTPAIWSGIFVTFLLGLILTWGISMIMDIRTMDQFDDPKGKTITVTATD